MILISNNCLSFTFASAKRKPKRTADSQWSVFCAYSLHYLTLHRRVLWCRECDNAIRLANPCVEWNAGTANDESCRRVYYLLL